MLIIIIILPITIDDYVAIGCSYIFPVNAQLQCIYLSFYSSVL